MYRFIKRTFDFCSSLLLFLVISPIFVVLMILVYIYIGRPVFFRQERTGKGMKRFNMIKFRTMTDKRDKGGELLPDTERITPFGNFLRRTSIDELPQLLNILRGDMSFVGPRPQLAEFLPHYTEVEKVRHSVRPGLTGLAQINGRNAISWEKRFEYDVEYVDNITFIGDWKIMFKTVGKVFKRDGITSETSVTMEEFMGSEEEVIAFE